MTRYTRQLVLLSAVGVVFQLGALTTEAIVNGEVDTTNHAVGAWIHGSSKCSGVMIARDGTVGWVLTAAHCATGSSGVFYEGNDHGWPDSFYAVVEVIVHPGYATDPTLDFALLRVDWVGPSTPLLSPLAPFEDRLTTGASMTISGFGDTELGYTSVRHSGVVEATTVSPTEIRSESSVNASSGDAGGAAIVNLAGAPRLAGVISNSDSATYTACARVSAVYVDFLVENIGLPTPPFFADGFESGNTDGWSHDTP